MKAHRTPSALPSSELEAHPHGDFRLAVVAIGYRKIQPTPILGIDEFCAKSHERPGGLVNARGEAGELKNAGFRVRDGAVPRVE